MPPEPLLTERQQREREFHDRYAKLQEDEWAEMDFSAVESLMEGNERRPWNAYWALTETVLEEYRRLGGEPRLLDFGSGSGFYALSFAKIGYRVEGFDISEESVAQARRAAEKYGLADRVSFRVGVAEQLDYDDGSFDVVVGIDILHHVEIGAAIREARRVLKPGGLGLFKEWSEAAVFDRLRNARFVRQRVPNEGEDFDDYRTADERKLNGDDLAEIKVIFPEGHRQYFLLFDRVRKLSRLSSALRPVEALLSRNARAARFDRWIIDYVPFVRPFCGEVLLHLRKEREVSRLATRE